MRDDPETDEEPGKIVHEYRPDADERFAYMGLAAARRRAALLRLGRRHSWFLVCSRRSATRRWPRSSSRPGARRAAGSSAPSSAAAGSSRTGRGAARAASSSRAGATRSIRSRSHGPGILRPDGSVPEPPLADADTQAVALVALRALGVLSGEGATAALAARMAERVAVGVRTRHDGARGGRPPGGGRRLAARLAAVVGRAAGGGGGAAGGTALRARRPHALRPADAVGLHPQFDADSYHRGSVWPFDSWLGWAGLRAAGRDTEAEIVRAGVLDALERLGRPHELYAVGPDGPRPIPLSNRIQAWTVGARWALSERWDGRPSGLFSDP